MGEQIKFRDWDGDGNEVVQTLYPEKWYDEDYVVGWCPERGTSVVVHRSNIKDGEAIVRGQH